MKLLLIWISFFWWLWNIQRKKSDNFIETMRKFVAFFDPLKNQTFASKFKQFIEQDTIKFPGIFSMMLSSLLTSHLFFKFNYILKTKVSSELQLNFWRSHYPSSSLLTDLIAYKQTNRINSKFSKNHRKSRQLKQDSRRTMSILVCVY